MVQLVQCPTCRKTYMKGDGVTLFMPKIKRWQRIKIWFWNGLHDLSHERQTLIHREVSDRCRWLHPAEKTKPSLFQMMNEGSKRKEGE